MNPFLRATEVIDSDSPVVREVAARLASGCGNETAIAEACFQWVRDTIPHTGDHALEPISCSASEVIQQGTGFCYAKSHLLAALLRANAIPAGLVYQRLGNDDGSFCLHGLNAVWLAETGWYRIDARGVRVDLRAEFTPPIERLPYTGTGAGEISFPGVWAEPVAVVVGALRRHRTRAELLLNLPDAESLQGSDAAWGMNAAGGTMTSGLTAERRELTSPEAQALIAALNAELSRTYPEEGATHFRLDPSEVAEGQGAFLIAYREGVAVGCGAFRRLDATTCELKRMYVVPEERGRGVGRIVLEALQAEARGLGLTRVVLETGTRQDRALALYERNGFARIAAFGEYVGSPCSVCLAKDL